MKTVTRTNDLHIDAAGLKKTALVYRAINHKLRQQIIKLLHKNGKMIVGDIYTKLKLEQSVASQHLAILRRAGFVNSERDRRFIYYSVNYKRLEQVHQKAVALLGED